MRVLNKTLKVLLLGTTLMTSAKAADLTLTAAEYAALSGTVAVGSPEADKAVRVANVVGSGLDKGYLGTVVANIESYFFLDGSSKLKALAIIGGKWCTFESGVLGTTSASGQIHLTQTKEDGSSVATKKLTINLTKTTGASLSAVAIGAWLKTALTSANKSFSASALKTLSAPAVGWTATALFQLVAGSNLAADAVAAAVDPIAFTLTAPVTPAVGGAAVNYTSEILDISAYNVALNDEYFASVALTNSSNTLTFALQPGLITSHGTSIMEGLVLGANNLARKRLKTSAPYTYPIPSDAASILLAKIGAASPSAIAEDLAIEHARLATDPTAGTTDTLRETVTVLLGKIASDAVNVQTSVAAQLARLATDPTAGTTDTVKEAIDVILAQISSSATNVQTALAAISATIGASSPNDIAADLAAQHARLVVSPNTLNGDITAILAQISAEATNVEADLRDIVILLGGATLKAGLVIVAKGYVDNALFTYADCSHTGAPEGVKYGAVAFTPSDITNLTNWRSVGASVEVAGKVNGFDRTFTCSVVGLETFTSNAEDAANKTVLEFSSSQGDIFWIKAFDATGLDASGFATVAFRDDYLAFLIADKFSAVTAITTQTLIDLRTAAAS